MGSGNFAVRLWRRTSLMQRLGFVALVPTLVTAVLLVTTMTHHQLATVRVMAQDTANAIAIQAAAVSAEPLRQLHRRELARIAQATGELPHVALVQIRSVDGEILADHHDPQADNAGGLTVIREVNDPRRPLGPSLGSVMVRVSLTDAIAAQRSSLHNALITLAISLLVAGIIGWQVARWLSAPLRRLVAAVQQLGHGDAPVAVEITDRTEIGQLQRGFNAASAALFDMHRDMAREIDQATRALADKNAALEAASIAKARFLAAASHDLRQPLYAL
ncbi:MAG TPA: HAMP domain-containing protein, partial [Rhodanobacter sp.]|nr:HAMP domain-containing protein [Rhodanobacter sp.]